jgi:hypothetical protein
MDTRGVDPFEGEPPSDDWPAGRPYPTRPYPTRPYPTRPYPTRPYPTRPYPTRPYPTRPYGAAQAAWRPYPTRPYPTRPYPTREEDVLVGTPDAGLDADEWTTDVSALFLSRSAVVRMGGRLLVGEGRIPVPRLDGGGPGYRHRGPEPPASDTGPTPAAASEKWQVPTAPEKPAVEAELGGLVPSRNELAWKVVVPDGLARDLAEQPEPAWGVKEDIAEALALGTDREMLDAIGRLPGRGVPMPGDPLSELVRTMLGNVRGSVRSSFRDAGWILSPATLNTLSLLPVVERTWDSALLVMPDGEDGGLLLGYPFVATQAVPENTVHFSADWSEAWIGMRRRVVTVDISEHAHFQSDETVIRAVTEYDLLVRKPDLFVTGTV